MASTLNPISRNSRSRSRSREHTGISMSRSRSSEHTWRRRSRSRIRRSRSPQIHYSPHYGGYQEEEDRETGNSTETAVVLSKPSVLDCPICLDPLSLPVYQCKNGHLACGSCCNHDTTCPSCNMPIKYGCAAIEQVLNWAKTPCRNRKRGCYETIFYSQKSRHEKSCEYTACSCPHDDCNYVGTYSRLYRHFSDEHSPSIEKIGAEFHLAEDRNRVFLQESRGSTLFVLNRKIEAQGSLFSVGCIAPPDECYTYKLKTCDHDRSIRLRGNVEVALKCSTGKHHLLIPNDFTDPHNEGFSLKLLIQE